MAMHKCSKLYNLIMAFQSFGGISMKALDASDVLTDEELDSAREMLLKMGEKLKEFNHSETWSDCGRLANEINKWMKERWD